MTKVCQLLLIGWRVNKNLMTASRNWSSERTLLLLGVIAKEEFYCRKILRQQVFDLTWKPPPYEKLKKKKSKNYHTNFFAIEDLLSCYFPNYSLWQIFSRCCLYLAGNRQSLILIQFSNRIIENFRESLFTFKPPMQNFFHFDDFFVKFNLIYQQF